MIKSLLESNPLKPKPLVGGLGIAYLGCMCSSGVFVDEHIVPSLALSLYYYVIISLMIIMIISFTVSAYYIIIQVLYIYIYTHIVLICIRMPASRRPLSRVENSRGLRDTLDAT